jgi:Fic-DOC domain mobile mystery protein B
MMLDQPEGATPLDPDELEGLKFAHLKTRGELDELEQANIAQGMLWLERRRRGDVLSDSFARTLHRRLFGEVWTWAGSYRVREKNIGVDPFQISVHVHNLLGNAQYWVDNQVYEPLEAAARFHHRLVQIHLFPNGNGRHARIMTDEFLKKQYRHPPIHWADGFDLQADSKRREAYIAALRAADAGDFEALLAFVT